MLINNSLLILLLISMASSGYSQTKPQAKPAGPATVKTSASPDENHTLLWEISGKGLTQPSFLYGTMHIICEDDVKMSEGLKKAIMDAKQVFFEIDMDDMEEMMGVLKYARMNNGLKISDLVTAEEFIRIEDYFKKNKSPLPLGMMSRFKPYFITAMISESLMTCEKKSSVEQLIMTEARAQEKTVSGLETVAFQSSLFDSIPYEKQARDLVSYVDSIDNYKKITVEMSDIYRRQDINSMDSLLVKSDPGLQQYMGILLYDRNKRWAEQIPEQAHEMSTLFAVGAGHLGGDKGVINLLRQQGFTVKPMKN